MSSLTSLVGACHMVQALLGSSSTTAISAQMGKEQMSKGLVTLLTAVVSCPQQHCLCIVLVLVFDDG